MTSAERELYVAPLPRLDTEQTVYITPTGDFTSLYGIPKNCKQPNAAAAALEFLCAYTGTGSMDSANPFIEELLYYRLLLHSKMQEIVQLIVESARTDYAIVSYGDSFSRNFFCPNRSIQ